MSKPSNQRTRSHKSTKEHAASSKLPVNMEKPVDRRAAMKLIIGGIGAVFWNIMANKLTPYVPPFSHQSGEGPRLEGVPSLEPGSRLPGRGEDARAFSDLAYQLFLSSGPEGVDFIAPQDWKNADGTTSPPTVSSIGGQLTYGHEAVVLKAISTFLNRDFGIPWTKMQGSSQAESIASEVLLGSGASNARVRSILGEPKTPRFGSENIKLHYSIGEEERKVRRWQYGGWVTPKIHTILSREGRVLTCPESDSGDQIDDYLLVTRAPGQFPGTTTTIFGGLHGPGTRSVERLFSSIPFKDLLELASIIDLRKDEVPYFQAIFRASKFRRHLEDDPTDSHVATQLELVTLDGCRPRRIEVG